MVNNNKVVVVTGGSGLIGRAILSDLLESKGWIVYNLDIFESTMPNIRNVICDITDPSSIVESLHAITRDHQQVDGLVNSAYPRTKGWGIAFESESFDSLQRNIEMQLSAVLFVCQQVGKYMLHGGSIVNMCSIYGIVGNDPGLYYDTGISPPAGYSAIKGGLVNFTRFLAARWGAHNIRVNCVSPGGIFDHQDSVFVKRYEDRVPLKRMGRPEDISPTVTFLLSEGAKYITGQNIVVDGGWTCI